MSSLDSSAMTCNVLSFACLSTVILSEGLIMTLLIEKVHQITAQPQVTRVKDAQYLIHMSLCGFGLVSCTGYIYSSYSGKITAGTCVNHWNMITLYLSLGLVFLFDSYLILRCCLKLFKTQYGAMHAWAVRLLAGALVTTISILINLSYILGRHGHTGVYLCQSVCIIAAICRCAAVQYMIASKPHYKRVEQITLSRSSPVTVAYSSWTTQNRCPSLLSKITPSVATTKRPRTIFSDRGRSLWLESQENTLGAGATPEGIAAYLAQVARNTSNEQSVSCTRHRHVSLLPSHPMYSLIPQPLYSCYPNYSSDQLDRPRYVLRRQSLSTVDSSSCENHGSDILLKKAGCEHLEIGETRVEAMSSNDLLDDFSPPSGTAISSDTANSAKCSNCFSQSRQDSFVRCVPDLQLAMNNAFV